KPLRPPRSDSASRRGGAFPIEDFHGPAIEVIRALFCFADTDDPELAKFRKCANQKVCGLEAVNAGVMGVMSGVVVNIDAGEWPCSREDIELTGCSTTILE